MCLIVLHCLPLIYLCLALFICAFFVLFSGFARFSLSVIRLLLLESGVRSQFLLVLGNLLSDSCHYNPASDRSFSARLVFSQEKPSTSLRPKCPNAAVCL